MLGTAACQAPLSMGFFRKEYWRGQPFPSPADPPDRGIKLRSPALVADSLPSATREAPKQCIKQLLIKHDSISQMLTRLQCAYL